MENDEQMLWNDYINLCEKFDTKFTSKEFGSLVVIMVSQMIFDCAPSISEAKELIEESVKEGYQIHLERKSNEKK